LGVGGGGTGGPALVIACNAYWRDFMSCQNRIPVVEEDICLLDSDDVRNVLLVAGHWGRNKGKDAGLEEYHDVGSGAGWTRTWSRLGLGGTTRRTWISSGGSGGRETAGYFQRRYLKISESCI
jgi:hypothetical protein